MDMTERGIITLMKAAITEQAEPLPEGFSLEDAAELIRRHGIDPLCWRGAIVCGIDRTLPVMQNLFRCYCVSTLSGERQMKAVRALYSAFDAAGIDYMPVKGCNMKLLYPEQGLRPMGDADILIRLEQYDRVRAIMQELGYQEGEESDHELVWQTKALKVELHKRLIPSYNRDYYRYYGTGWQLAKRSEGTHWYMTDEDTMVYLFTHFSKHYRDGGIGCKAVLDLWLFAQKNPALDQTYIRAQLAQLGLGEFYSNMQQLIRVWFEGDAPDERSEFITGYIMNSGVEGQLATHFLAWQVRRRAEDASVDTTQGGQLRAAAFPPLEVIAQRWPAAERHPWALPLFWVRRGLELCFKRRDVIRKRLDRIKMAPEDQIDAFQQSLDYVGLRFDFREK